MVDSALPERTILVGRQSQRKLDGRAGCAADRWRTASFEVIRTFERPKRVRLDVFLLPLLEVAAGKQRVGELHALLLEISAQMQTLLMRPLDLDAYAEGFALRAGSSV